jgi:hypothetical protein
MYSPLDATLDVPQLFDGSDGETHGLHVAWSHFQTAEWESVYNVSGGHKFGGNQAYGTQGYFYGQIGERFGPQDAQPSSHSSLQRNYLSHERLDYLYLRQLRTLQQHYTVLDSDRVVIELLKEQSTLYMLLVEAVRPSQIAFGEKGLLHVRAQHSEDDWLLKVAVQLPANFGDDQAEEALRSFDREWWLNNCHRSGGVLVFDYEIRDAV